MVQRHVCKCGRCGESLAFEGSPLYGAQLPACPFCGGRLNLVGQVTDDARRAHIEGRAACDDRCIHAKGTACHCKCQGANHASGLVVSVVVVDGKPIAQPKPDPKRDARVAKFLADRKAFYDTADRLRADIEAAHPQIRPDAPRAAYGTAEYTSYVQGLRALQHIQDARASKRKSVELLDRIREQYHIPVAPESTPAPVAPPEPELTSPVCLGTMYPVGTSTQEGSGMATTAAAVSSAGKLMPAKFPGRCTACSGSITVGQQISYRRGDVRHARCAGAAPVAAAPFAKFTPTPEQERVLDLFDKGGHLAIEAGAGTGKTSTLRLIAETHPDKTFRYVAFNKSIVVDSAAKFPSNVQVSTIHSLAWATMRERFGERFGGPRMGRNQIAAYLGIRPIEVEIEGGKKVLAPSYLAGRVMGAIAGFCNSADKAPTTRHFEPIDGIDAPGEYRNNDKIRAHLAGALDKAWADIQKDDRNGTGVLPFGHSHYLKIWELSHPRIAVDVILFDEAQDAFPVLRSIVEQQAGHAQLVFVGDSNQTIYTWLGCENALASVPADNRAYLTASFRFGQGIADVANAILANVDTPMRLTGKGPASTVGIITNPRAILTRTNAAAVEQVFRYIDLGKRPHLVGNAAEIIKFARAAEELKTTGTTQHPELAWASSWSEVQDYVAEGATDLGLMVKLVDDYGTDRIVAALEGMPSEDRADVVISTAHKSKGREWDTVRLSGDFPAEPESEEAWRLLYVACTRAKRALDVTACQAVKDLLGAAQLSSGSSEPDLAPVRHLHSVA